MKLAVLALDYDGTLTRGAGLDPDVREAIATARTGGVAVLLVTGRRLDDLRAAAGDLHVVDGVVAENGAVVHFPASGHTSALAPPVPPPFLAALAARGIAHEAGRCLVDADAAAGPALLDVIRRLELPLVLAFNRGRVMTLPQGVSKATGVRAALEMLRRSPRNTLAIGDAENDHELLRVAEIGAAVEWGSAALRESADLVVSGRGPAAVAAFLRPLLAAGELPRPARARRRLVLGHTEEGEEFSLAVRGRNVLVTGDARSGKSWVAGLLCEQLILFGYAVCVIDPEGDYRSLEGLPGVTVLGGDGDPPPPRALLRALRHPDQSVVIDLSHLPHDDKIEYVRAALPALNEMRRRTGLPHRILIDEAHYFLHDAAAPYLLDLKRNGYTVVTYRASRLPSELLAAAEVVIVTCESNPAEIDALVRCCGPRAALDARWRTIIAHLPLGQAVAWPVTEEAEGQPRRFLLGPRLTPHVRHREKYVDMPVLDHHAFVFTTDGYAPARRAHTLREFVAAIEAAPAGGVDGHLRRRDFSRWIGDVFGDRVLADDLARHEARYAQGQDPEAADEIVAAIRARYDLAEAAAGSETT